MRICSLIGLLLILGTLGLSIWLSIWVMLVGGITAAITGFLAGDVAMGVWGIVRAIFFEWGFLPFGIGTILGLAFMTVDD